MTAATCNSCGSQLTTDAAFCEECGTARRAPDPATGLWRSGSQADRLPGQPFQYLPPHPAGGPAPDHLVGEATPNETYLGNRLCYSDTTTDFDPLTNRNYLGALATRFVAVVAAWCMGQAVLFLIFGIVGFKSAFSSTVSLEGTSGGGGSSMLTAWSFLSFAWSVVLAVLFWFTKLSAQVSQWMLTVDGKGRAARGALEHMYSIIQARRTPVGNLRVIQINPPGQAPRDYLQVEDGNYLGFVSSFAYGSDLYIGWTFWLNLSPARWVIRTFERMFRGRGTGLYGSLIWDQPKALREVLHSAVRQGVDVASGEIEPVGQGMLGTAVAIQPVSI